VDSPVYLDHNDLTSTPKTRRALDLELSLRSHWKALQIKTYFTTKLLKLKNKIVKIL